MDQQDQYKIDFSDVRVEKLSSDAVLTFSDERVLQAVGQFSESVWNHFGSNKLGVQLRAERYRLHDEKLMIGQSVRTSVFEHERVKVIVNAYFGTHKRFKCVEEQQIRQLFLYAMRHAAKESCSSIALPICPVPLQKSEMQLLINVLLQSIFLFVEIDAPSTLRTFSIVTELQEYRSFIRNTIASVLKHGCFLRENARLLRIIVENEAKGPGLKCGQQVEIRIFSKMRSEKKIETMQRNTFILKCAMEDVLKEDTEFLGGYDEESNSNETETRASGKRRESFVDEEEDERKRRKNMQTEKARLARLKKRKSDKMITTSQTAPGLAEIRRQSETDSPVSSTVSSQDATHSESREKQREASERANRASLKCVQKKKRVAAGAQKAADSRRKQPGHQFLWKKSVQNKKDYLMNGVKELNGFGRQELQLVLKQILKQLNFDVGGPDGMSPDERKQRQLCRMSFHLHQDDGKEYSSIVDIWPELWQIFMGYKVDDNDDEKTADTQQTAGELIAQKRQLLTIDDVVFGEDDDESDRTYEESYHDESVDDEHSADDDDDGDDEEEAQDEDDGEDENEHESSDDETDDKDKSDKDSYDSTESTSERPEMSARKSKSPFLLPLKDVEIVDYEEALVNLYGEKVQEVCRDKDEEYLRDVLKVYTRARRCDADCPRMSVEEAVSVYEAIRRNCLAVDVLPISFLQLEYDFDGKTHTLKYWIDKYAACSQGVRTLSKRFSEVQRLLWMIDDCERFLKNVMIDGMKKLLELDCLSAKLRQKFYNTYVSPRPDDHHHEAAVRAKFSALTASYLAAMENQEDAVCDICQQLTARNSIVERQMALCKHALSPEVQRAKGDVCNVCHMCYKELKVRSDKLQVPAAASINLFKPNRVPEELACLSLLERMLIERVRAVQKIMVLTTKRGARKTPMKATTGSFVLLPTQINATVDHVLKTLPSGSNLVITVRTPWDKQLKIRLPKLIAALKWLKRNNPLYADINIDENFTLKFGEEIFIARPDATQADADALIVRDDDDDDDDDGDDADDDAKPREPKAKKQKKAEPPKKKDIKKPTKKQQKKKASRDDDEDGDDEHGGNYLLTQDNIVQQPIRAVFQPKDTELAHARYTLKRHAYDPLSIDTKDVDMMVFPMLHPYGNDGLHALRIHPVKLPKYLRTRLLQSDREFATDANFLCFFYAYKQQKGLTSIQGVQARIPVGLQAKDFNVEDDERLQRLLYSPFHKWRGFPQYWMSVKYALRAEIATFGPPCFFLTLNPDEKNWKDLHELYGRIKKRNDVSASNIVQLIAEDPVIFARYWRRRVKCFMREVILRPDGPLGTVVHYFWRVEYQQRGTEHIHCLLWVADRPSADEPASVHADFIDRYITCRLPDADKEPELRAVVKRVQYHLEKHTPTCQTMRRYKGKLRKSRCRFGFPRKESRRTIFFSEKPKYSIPGLHDRPYCLARKRGESHINDYNPAILLAWQGNIDLQYIPGGARDVVNYITAYTTKGEKAKNSKVDMAAIMADTNMPRSKVLWKVGVEMLNQHVVGLLEIADDLMGHENFFLDRAVAVVRNDPARKRMRVLKPKQLLTSEKSVVHEDNFMDNYYPNRHANLENCSVYNLMINFEIVTTREGDTSRRSRPLQDDEKGDHIYGVGSDADDDDEDDDNNGVACLFTDTQEEDGADGSDGDYETRKRDASEKTLYAGSKYHHFVSESPFFCHPNMKSGDRIAIRKYPRKAMRKTKQKIARLYLPKGSANDPKVAEDIFERLVLTFVPWRNEERILEEHGCETFAALWIDYLARLKKEHFDAWSDMDRLLKGYSNIRKEEANWAKKLEQIRRAKETLEVDEEAEDHLQIHDRNVNEERHSTQVASLNDPQKEIYEMICGTIAKQNEQLRADEAAGARKRPVDSPIQLFVSGTAGTGKSYLINSIADELTMRYVQETRDSGLRPAVLIAAPTGIAALAIGGNTIHSLFCIEVTQVDQQQEPEFSPIPAQKFDKWKFLFSNVRLLIIDEISMVSNVILMKIHKRLVEISGFSVPFGGFNVLFLGDLLQLAPVHAAHAFKALTQSVERRVFSSTSLGFNLWHCLEYRELIENMRQGDDLKTAEMFNRVRCGVTTPSDLETLRGRCMRAANGVEPSFQEIAKFLIKLLKKDHRAMALFGKNAEVNELNMNVIKLIRLKCVTINAEDFVDEAFAERERFRNKTQQRRPWQSLPISAAKKKRQQHTKKKNDRDDGATGQQPRNDDDKDDGAPKKGDSADGNDADEEAMKPLGDVLQTVDQKMHGGLPASLLVAVGARVMLRRNIDIRMRLVNGATGVVRRLLPDSKNVELIDVEWDDNPDVDFPIPKMEARYKHAHEQVMIRRQFPLVLCYGATIHKSQGLTLQNVVLKSRHIWAPGMFYVGISRVTHLSGLHLAGFDETSIRVDPDAKAEANRLRESIGLPTVEEAALATSFDVNVAAAAAAAATKSADDDDSSSDGGSSRSDDDAAAAAAADSQVRALSQLSMASSQRSQRIAHEVWKTVDEVAAQMPQLHLSESMRKYRFAELASIGVLHLLAMMERVYEAIVGGGYEDDENPAYAKLEYVCIREVIRRRVHDVFEIFDIIINKDGYHTDGCFPITAIDDPFRLIVDVLPKNVRHHFDMQCRALRRCGVCGNVEEVAVRQTVIWLPSPDEHRPVQRIDDAINEYIDSWNPVYGADDQCRQVVYGERCTGGRQQKTMHSEPARYLVVGQRQDDVTYRAVGRDPVRLGQGRYLLIGAIRVPAVKNDADDDDDDGDDSGVRTMTETWYWSPDPDTRGWIYSADGGYTTQIRPNLAMAGLSFFVWVLKPKERKSKDAKKREQDAQDRVLDAFEDIRNVADDSAGDNASDDYDDDDDDESDDASKSSTNSYGKPISESDLQWDAVNVFGEAIEQQEKRKVLEHGRLPYLLLTNSGTDCFFNCALNVLFCCEGLRNSIANMVVELPAGVQPTAMEHMIRIFQRQTDSCAEMRSKMRGLEQGQQDVSDAFERIICLVETAHPEVAYHMAYELVTRTKCSNEDCETSGAAAERETRLYSRLSMRNNDSFRELFKKQWRATTGRCRKCYGSTTSLMSAESTGRYHIMVCDRDDARFTDFDINAVWSMFQHDWKVIGFVEYISFTNTNLAGHYRFWTRSKWNQKKWTCISDNCVQLEVRSVDVSTMNINVLVFERYV